MGNYLILIITALTVLPIVLGVLLGLLRGSRRSLLRLILVILCVVLAFALCGAIAEKMLSVDVSVYVDGEEPMTVEQYLQQMLGEDMEDMSSYVVPLLQIIVKIVLFLLLFLVFQFISWLIVYPLCKLFVKPRKVTDSNGRTRKKKHRLVGAAVGLVQGIVVALCLCIVVNGLVVQTNNLMTAVDGMSEISNEMSDGESGESGEPVERAIMAEEGRGGEDAEQGEAPDGGADLSDMKAIFAEYSESALGKLYNSIGDKPFGLIARVKNADGDTITLSGQVEALNGIVDIAKEFVEISKVDFTDFYSKNSDDPDAVSPIQKLTDILTNIENIKQGLSEEANKTISGLLGILGDKFDIDLNKYYDLNLANEAAAFNRLSSYKDKDFSAMSPDEIKEEAKELVKDLAKSELLINVLAEQDLDLGYGLDQEQVDEIDSTLADLVADGTLDDETAQRLRDIFLPQVNE